MSRRIGWRSSASWPVSARGDLTEPATFAPTRSRASRTSSSGTREFAKIGLAVVLALWWLKKVLWSNADSQWDFKAYYHAAQMWRAGSNPYSVAPPASSTETLQFLYPPYALGVFAPFALLSLQKALALFLFLKLVAFGWLVAVWTRLLRTSVTSLPWILFLIFAYSSAIFVDFASGNVTVFEQCIFWTGAAFLVTKRYWGYVCAVVVAALFKLSPIALLIVCAAIPDRRRFRYLAAGGLAFTAVLLATCFLSPRLTGAFLQTLSTLDERGRVNPASLALVRDAATLVTGAYGVAVNPGIQTAIYGLLAAAIILPTVWTARRVASTASANRMEVLLYLTILAYALVLPRFKNYSYMFVIVPTYYIATHSTRIRSAAPLLLVACLPVYSWITTAGNTAFLASYSPWLIALGAWLSYLYELSGGGLLQGDEGLPCPN